ncbi:hypothetical protein [Virgibacillus salexigens]|uniref:Uncharacterized protein n=2 Tax=Virgibacillus TaxID=84406 RepID=A0A024QAH7_9BACI|nr:MULTISPECIES: hypothetical protein [Virgibacillus]GGJ48880.1 hypothetical protein GCM10007111_08630 [Virgibacillus kapii]CDQ39513.1 hypothetical protein BN990_01818 [Virgibacillus massiliensis]
MAHVRKDSSRPTTTISWDKDLLTKVDDYRFEKRKDNRSMAINELAAYGLKYVELVEKQRAKKLAKA